jgi:type 1 fimbriae regulatory protein FimB/type 1 fimbriae regulatory protein FimE
MAPIELDAGWMHVYRAKRERLPCTPVRGDEIRALRRLRRENLNEAHVFIAERGGPMTTVGFHHLIRRLGEAAGIPSRCARTC